MNGISEGRAPDGEPAPRTVAGASRTILRGRVVPGSRRGRRLGFPTANLALDSDALPPSGIYAVWVRLRGERSWRPGAASVGYNPTYPARRRLAEVHILDYRGGDLYGAAIEVLPVQYLREEMRFDSAGELVRQMQQDCQRAREALEAAGSPERQRSSF